MLLWSPGQSRLHLPVQTAVNSGRLPPLVLPRTAGLCLGTLCSPLSVQGQQQQPFCTANWARRQCAQILRGRRGICISCGSRHCEDVVPGVAVCRQAAGISTHQVLKGSLPCPGGAGEGHWSLLPAPHPQGCCRGCFSATLQWS